MALNFPDVGENLALEMIVNKTAAQNLSLRLYLTNITPSDTDTATTYSANEASFTGYSAITLTGASWGTAASGAITYGSQQTFTCSGTGATQNVYGYFVTQVTSGILLYSEKDASAPAPITNSGDKLLITPTIGAN